MEVAHSCFKNLLFMGHDRLYNILGFYSIPGIDFSFITRPKIPALASELYTVFVRRHDILFTIFDDNFICCTLSVNYSSMNGCACIFM